MHTLQGQKKTVAMSGCFDILHIGHIHLIDGARKHGDELVVLVESDEFIITFKNRQPFHTQQERAEMLAHIVGVDVVVLLPFMSGKEDYGAMWKKVRPQVIAHTEGDPYIAHKKEQAAEIGAKVIEVTPLIPHKSTTNALTHHPSKHSL
ncbi:MAG: Glycerol-3-phosphate cytidylyltransferase [Microgenomates bacterium OLB23]|nr:MAG: Glycerol-3-phosphate cytidylyltransferase [Microgenomates bacterium OLB23]